tara:strand:- start:14369 stop:15691 length:1323 start_codon:yes stop_codon:yes gene_type:complete
MFNRDQVLVDTMSLIFFSTMAIAIVFPFFNSIVEIQTWRRNPLDNDAISLAQLQYFWFGFGIFLVSITRFAFNRAFFRKSIEIDVNATNFYTRPSHKHDKDFTLRAFILVSIIIGLVLYSYYIYKVGIYNLISNEDYTAKYAAAGGLGFFSFGLQLVVIGCCLNEILSEKLSISLLITRILIITILIWATFFIYTRFITVSALLIFASVVVRKVNFKISNLRLKHFALASFLLFGLSFYVIARGMLDSPDFFYELTSWFQENSDIALGIFVGSNDLVHPFQTCIELITDPKHYGPEAFFDSFGSLVPSFIYPERSLSEGQMFAESFYPELFYKGGGTGFSLVGSSAVYFIPNIGPFIYGIVLAFLGWIFEISANKSKQITFSYVLLISSPVYFIFIERAGLIGTIKPLVGLGVILLSILFIVSLLNNLLIAVNHNKKKAS